MYTVAVVDDEPGIRQFAAGVIGIVHGHPVELYPDGVDFLARYGPKRGCILLGISMPYLSGLDVLRELRRRGNRVPVVTMSGAYNPCPQAIELGALAHLAKPFSVAQLVGLIGRACAASRGPDGRRGG